MVTQLPGGGAGPGGRPGIWPGIWPRVSPCRWCHTPVLRDNDGRWIHASLSYVCRDRWGGLAATTAEPGGMDRGVR